MKIYKSARILILGCMSLFPCVGLISIAIPAQAEVKVEFSQAQLDQMVAPIALYPDTILSQVLIAATYPIEIVQADRWARTHTNVKGADAVNMVSDKDWDPSVKALVAFPDILQRMSDDIDWTQRLGDAFLSNEAEVMDTVQRLRKRAYAAGSLDKTEHIKVENSDNTIIIEPAQERVVYVPVYDTRVVYGNWWWPDYPPVYWHYPTSYTYVSGSHWGSSIYVGPTYYRSACHWRDRRVVVVDYRDHYHNDRRFYTGRSIVTYEGARAWRHDPNHRRGVAYYNDNLRNSYGSRHQSYHQDRDYRDRYRNHQSDRTENRERSVTRNFNQQPHNEVNRGHQRDGDNRVTVDRSEQLRTRMNQQNQERVDEARHRITPNLRQNGHTSHGNTPQLTTRRSDEQPRQLETTDRSFNRREHLSNENRNTARQDHSPNTTQTNYNVRTGMRTPEQPRVTEQPRQAPRAVRIDDSLNRRVEAPNPRTAPAPTNIRTLRGREDESKRQ